MTLTPETLLPLNSLDGYRNLYHDAVFWTPFVQEVCQKHGLYPSQPVICRVPGTYPTFIVADRWVVKFFGQLFDGDACFHVEQTCAQLLAEHPILPTPTLIASGRLFDPSKSWPWPYLVFKYLPGVSIGEVYIHVNMEDRIKIAREMGEWVCRLHALPLPAGGQFTLSWRNYRVFLNKQHASCVVNHRQWGSLPLKWINQIEAYLLPVNELLDESQLLHLIHADLTADHLLGRIVNGGWESLGVIDFGDAMIGTLEYELVALQMDLFRGDRRMLNVFLKTLLRWRNLLPLFGEKRINSIFRLKVQPEFPWSISPLISSACSTSCSAKICTN
jgi:hygromycin-B 7''-O-kinase